MFHQPTRALASGNDSASHQHKVSALPDLYHQHTTFKAKSSDQASVLNDLHAAAGAMSGATITWKSETQFEVQGMDEFSSCVVLGEIFERPVDGSLVVECQRSSGCGVLFNQFYCNLHKHCADNQENAPISLTPPPFEVCESHKAC